VYNYLKEDEEDQHCGRRPRLKERYKLEQENKKKIN